MNPTDCHRSPIFSRRSWIKNTAAAGAALMASSRARAATAGANSDLRVAVIGLRLRGTQLIDELLKAPGTRVVSICDVDRDVLAAAGQKLSAAGHRFAAGIDFRRVLDDRNVDVVVIATPDHWHALMAVMACQAGKDVYVEKPVSHNIWEGRQIVEAARKHGRIVAAGLQNRSDVGLQLAAEYIHAGKLGRVKLCRLIDDVRRESIGKVAGPQPIPPSVDYDLFMGPADLEPLRRKELHYDWHWFWSTGTGDCGNRGVHTFDHARWICGITEQPARVQTIGGRFGYDDDGETPNAQITFLDTKPVPMLFELRSLPVARGTKQMPGYRGHPHTTMFIECEGGYLTGGRGGARAWSNDDTLIQHFPGDGGRSHLANFLDAVRERKPGRLRADIAAGHVSTNLCHLANLSYRIGHRRSPAEIAAAVQDEPLLAECFERMQQHLRANEIDLAATPAVLGPRLQFDAATERFQGAGAELANMYLCRNYREPFTFPAI